MDFVRDLSRARDRGRYGRIYHPTDSALGNMHEQTRSEQTRPGMAWPGNTNLGQGLQCIQSIQVASTDHDTA